MKKKKLLFIFLLLLLFISSNNVYAAHADFMAGGSYVSCGDGLVKTIPSIIPRISSSLYNSVMVLIPAILVLMGAVDLLKGIMSQKEDEIKKGRDTLIKRIIMGMVTFLIVMLVKLLVGVVAGNASKANGVIGCVDCFISNSCDSSSETNSANESTPKVA